MALAGRGSWSSIVRGQILLEEDIVEAVVAEVSPRFRSSSMIRQIAMNQVGLRSRGRRDDSRSRRWRRAPRDEDFGCD